MKIEHTKFIGICMIPEAIGDDSYEDSSGATTSPSIVINGPPRERCCSICNRSISDLKAFGGPGDPCVGDFTGAKLVKRFREDLPGYVGASWECRDCLIRPGGLWQFDEEDRLGRRLTETEIRSMRADLEKELDEMHKEESPQ